ncbi:MAG: FtsQ-type POTRA domain-containing protein [Alphaproteobacteria bacterium]|nr:FtsQ-type POTRA domain-containing protein [Alphaproteobacteria bacterium]
MSLAAGPFEPEFVQPNEAVPTGFAHMRARPGQTFDGTGRRARARRATIARRTLHLRRLLPYVCALIAVALFAVWTRGGTGTREALPMDAYLETALERIGLGLSEVTVEGQRMTGDAAIYDRLHLSDSRSIWLLDTQAARKRVETLPWVEKAVVKRVFPDRLHVVIRERTPRAVWSDGKRAMLIDRTGRVLGPADASSAQTEALPTVFGAGAAPASNAIIETIEQIPELKGKVVVYEWTANRRWTLHLTNGGQILLPASGQSLALMQLINGKSGDRLIDLDFKKLDLRIASQAAIEMRQ